jgi:hypothetical protein
LKILLSGLQTLIIAVWVFREIVVPENFLVKGVAVANVIWHVVGQNHFYSLTIFSKKYYFCGVV